MTKVIIKFEEKLYTVFTEEDIQTEVKFTIYVVKRDFPIKQSKTMESNNMNEIKRRLDLKVYSCESNSIKAQQKECRGENKVTIQINCFKTKVAFRVHFN